MSADKSSWNNFAVASLVRIPNGVENLLVLYILTWSWYHTVLIRHFSIALQKKDSWGQLLAVIFFEEFKSKHPPQPELGDPSLEFSKEATRITFLLVDLTT